MDPEDFSVPGVLESPLGEEFKKKAKPTAVVKEPPSRRALKRKKEDAQMVVYGAKKNDATLATTAKHTSALAPVVSELAALEREIQQMFCECMWSGQAVTETVSKVRSAAPQSRREQPASSTF